MSSHPTLDPASLRHLSFSSRPGAIWYALLPAISHSIHLIILPDLFRFLTKDIFDSNKTMRFQIISMLALFLASTTFAAPIHLGTNLQGISHHDDSPVGHLHQYPYAQEHKGISARYYEEELDIRDLGEDMEMEMMKREPTPGCIGDACKAIGSAAKGGFQNAGKSIKLTSAHVVHGVTQAAKAASKKTH
jgi:hypothetical protein